MSGDDLTAVGPAAPQPAAASPGPFGGGTKSPIEARTYVCSICGEPSTEICVFCTKDACNNHLCAKCGRCSDCCECDIR
jgi:hypothetical protein